MSFSMSSVIPEATQNSDLLPLLDTFPFILVSFGNSNELK